MSRFALAWRLAYEIGPLPLVAALALALLLVVVQCGAPVFAQATPASGATTLTWDVYEVEAENIDSYRLYYWPAGQTPGETFPEDEDLLALGAPQPRHGAGGEPAMR